jgi:hypothetical protein
MKEYKWGRIMTSNQIGLMITWGKSINTKPQIYFIRNSILNYSILYLKTL